MLDPSRIFICNFPHDTTCEIIKERCSNIGPVKHVLICTEKDTGKPKGFGFVQMDSAEDAQRAIQELDGTMMGDRVIRVALAHERPARQE